MRLTDDTDLKQKVSRFWDETPCGSFSPDEPIGETDFFDEVRKFRTDSQEFVYRLVDFRQFAGKRMLEVGCGLGSDLLHAATLGADVVGFDLSRRSVGLARKHFALSGIDGQFVHGDAEGLPFGDDSFDVVYSFGVLHHTPDTQRAIDECLRVLKPGGQMVLMLYNSSSWLTVVEPYLQRLKRMVFRARNAGELNRVEIARKYDGEDNPLGKAYSTGEISQMLAGFSDVSLKRGTPRLTGAPFLLALYYAFLDYSGINARFGFWSIATATKA